MDDWCSERADGAVLRIHVAPRARRTEVAGRHGDALKIRLAAPPVDNKANRALLEFLAQQLGAAGSALELLSGHTGRDKRVLVRGMHAATARARLGG